MTLHYNAFLCILCTNSSCNALLLCKGRFAPCPDNVLGNCNNDIPTIKLRTMLMIKKLYIALYSAVNAVINAGVLQKKIKKRKQKERPPASPG